MAVDVPHFVGTIVLGEGLCVCAAIPTDLLLFGSYRNTGARVKRTTSLFYLLHSHISRHSAFREYVAKVGCSCPRASSIASSRGDQESGDEV